MASQPSRTRPGFTLVEMLVVITIIGILVALLIPVIAGTMARTKNAAVAAEVQELARAIEAYKNKTGDYPPDFTNYQAVLNHMSKAYPRNTRDVAAWLAAAPARDLDAAESLVFWLSMTSKNVRDPLGGGGDRNSFFTFDETRLRTDADGDGWPEFYPKYGTDAPYVYFDGRQISVPDPSDSNKIKPTYAYAWAVYPSPYSPPSTYPPGIPPAVPTRSLGGTTGIPGAPTSATFGVVRPYRSNLNVPATEIPTWQGGPPAARTQWMAPNKFQIIAAGLDSHFGVQDPTVLFKSFPTMNYYSAPDLDRTYDESNITSFSEMKTVGDSVP